MSENRRASVTTNVQDDLRPGHTLPFYVSDAKNLDVVRISAAGDITIFAEATMEHLRWALEEVVAMLLRERSEREKVFLAGRPPETAPTRCSMGDDCNYPECGASCGDTLLAPLAGTSPETPAVRETCPACGSANVRVTRSKRDAKWGTRLEVPRVEIEDECTICFDCGEKLYSPEQAEASFRALWKTTIEQMADHIAELLAGDFWCPSCREVTYSSCARCGRAQFAERSEAPQSVNSRPPETAGAPTDTLLDRAARLLGADDAGNRDFAEWVAAADKWLADFRSQSEGASVAGTSPDSPTDAVTDEDATELVDQLEQLSWERGCICERKEIDSDNYKRVVAAAEAMREALYFRLRNSVRTTAGLPHETEMVAGIKELGSIISEALEKNAAARLPNLENRLIGGRALALRLLDTLSSRAEGEGYEHKPDCAYVVYNTRRCNCRRASSQPGDAK